MKLLTALITSAILCSAAPAGENLANVPLGAYARRYTHRDGTYTLTAKQGDKSLIVEETYNAKHIMKCKRVFQTDSQGRLRNGVVYDGKKNPLGSIWYGFDKKTDLVTQEQHYNKKGQLICWVFYPGALKDYPNIDPQLVRRGAALYYNPDDPKAKPVQADAPAPVAPVQGEQGDFKPGVQIERPAQSVSGGVNQAAMPALIPPANAAALPAATPPGGAAAQPAPGTPAPADAAKPVRKRSFFGKPRN